VLRAVCIIYLLLDSAASFAITISTPLITDTATCLTEAIHNNTIQKKGEYVSFSCLGNTAEIMFDQLSQSIQSQIVTKGQAQSDTLHFGNSSCSHGIKDDSGNAASYFRCDLDLLVGPALNQ
jgi:hypothetical protein